MNKLLQARLRKLLAGIAISGYNSWMSKSAGLSSPLRIVLLLAAMYYLLCGFSAIVWPALWFRAAGIPPLENLATLRVIGALMLALSLGLGISANAPGSAWLVLLITLTHSVLDAIVTVHAGFSGELPAGRASIFVLVDLFWAAVFTMGLREIYFAYLWANNYRDLTLEQSLGNKPLGCDLTLSQLSDRQPLAVVLLRHAGCTFCREYLTYLAGEQKQLESRGVRLTIVSMSRPDVLRELAARYGLGDALLVSDPAQTLYRALGMRRGRIRELFGVPEFVRAIIGGRLFKFGIGWIDGDGFQLHGCTVIYQGRVVAVRPASRASEICSVSEVLDSAGPA